MKWLSLAVAGLNWKSVGLTRRMAEATERESTVEVEYWWMSLEIINFFIKLNEGFVSHLPRGLPQPQPTEPIAV